MLTRIKFWFEARRVTKKLVPEIRRAMQLLEASQSVYKPKFPFSDQEVLLVAAHIGLDVLRGQCFALDILSPNSVLGRVVEVPLGKEHLH